jgi:hypothetical protein
MFLLLIMVLNITSMTVSLTDKTDNERVLYHSLIVIIVPLSTLMFRLHLVDRLIFILLGLFISLAPLNIDFKAIIEAYTPIRRPTSRAKTIVRQVAQETGSSR